MLRAFFRAGPAFGGLFTMGVKKLDHRWPPLDQWLSDRRRSLDGLSVTFGASAIQKEFVRNASGVLEAAQEAG